MKKLSSEKMEKIDGGSAPALDCLNMELAFAQALGDANEAYYNYGETSSQYRLASAIAAGDGLWLATNCY